MKIGHMTMKRICLSTVFAGIVLAFLTTPTMARAASTGFALSAKLPENQISANTFFDLKVVPEQREALTLVVKNLEDQPVTLEVSPNPAFTNNNGVIEYSQYDYPKDSSAQYTLPELFSEPQEVSLAANEEKEVTFQLTVPKTPFNGTILGGIYALRKADEKDRNAPAIRINNQFAMVLGVALTEDPSQTILPQLRLNAVQAGVVNARTSVTANLQNSQPQGFSSMSVEAKIYQKGSKTVYRKSKKKDLEMAPNSNFDFAIDWQDQPIEAGKYQLTLIAKSGTERWQFTRDFSVTAQNAKKVNEEALNLKKPSFNWWLLLLALLLLLILLLLAYKLGKRKQTE
ncbi:cell surface protein [Enterococcus florum]|uniref:Cell surface protein n=1 Tax=Enterococcus florum TaxID=2480627 RepID=A0A4V0WP98_9ENTE|nr:DUF916 and DUF3324 domain-containing protein [Enterococcus florum]GCF93109.1 cell surface protein [Enterococcus florum]